MKIIVPIPITSQSLLLLVLAYIIDQIESGDTEALIEAGMLPEHLMRLRQCTMADLNQVAQATGVAVVQVDAGRLMTTLAARDRRQQQSEDLAQLAKAGAPTNLLSKLFGISQGEADSHVAALGILRKRGRVVLPPVSVRDQIHQWWAVNPFSDLPQEKRWLACHEAFPDYSVAVLFATVNEFEGGE